MRPTPLALSALCLAAALAHAVPAAAGPSRDAMNARLRDELAAIAPAAVADFDDANRAREHDPARALAAYRRVIDAAPAFPAAKRRACNTAMQLGQRSEALSLCRAAVAHEEDVFSLCALATALALPPAQASADDAREADALVERAKALAPTDPYPVQTRAELQMARGDLTGARASIDTLAKWKGEPLDRDEMSALWGGLARTIIASEERPSAQTVVRADEAIAKARAADPEGAAAEQAA